MPGVNFINENNKKILLIDFSCSSNKKKVLKTADDAVKTVSKIKKKKSILAIVDFSNSKFDKEMTLAVRRMSDHNRPYIKFIAIVGLGFFKSIFLKLFFLFSRNGNHRVFSTKLKAILWLSEK
jgi:hypothetical protein